MTGDTAEYDAVATRTKPFLVGGSGWHRQVAALNSGGRYVPKGGFVVDFTTRGRYSNEINRKWAGKGDEEEQTSGEFSGGSSSSSSVAESESWADRIVLRHTQDVLYELSPPLKEPNGVSPIDVPGRKLATIKEDASAPPFLPQQKETAAAEKHRQYTRTTRPLESFKADKQSWKPPGPCTPPRSSSGSAAAFHHRRHSIPDYGRKKKQNGKPKIENKSALKQPHDCSNCECCAQIRKTLEETEATTRQDKAAAAHLRRRLEQEMAKLTKERRDFESFKEEEIKNIRGAAEELAHKQHRDRLAEGARQRAAAKSISLHDKTEADSLRAELEVERREAGKEAGRWRMEKEKLHRKISHMEKEISRLSAGMKEAESEKIHAWEEARRYKELAQHREIAWQTQQQNTNNQKSSFLCRSPAAGSLSSSVVAVIGGSPGVHPSCCGDDDMSCVDQVNSPGSCSSSAAAAAAAPAEHEEPATATPKIEENEEPCISLPEIVRYPNGTIQRTWRNGHISTTFINGDIKQELPSGIIQYFFKEVSVWQVSHPASGIETFYFPNGRVESHVPDPTRKEQEENGTHTLSIEKETLLPGGAGALRSIDGGESRQVPVKIASLRKETLLPRPVPLMSR